MSEVVEKQHTGKGLETGALGLWGNVTIGLGSTAPAYSLAATLGYVVLRVGEQAPAMFVLAFLPMLLVAVAYRELNRAAPDCGTTFTWGTKALGPWVGWMGGWGLAVSAIIVLANVAEIAGTYMLLFFGADELAENAIVRVALGIVFIVVMTYVSYRGIVLSERIQAVLVSFQFLVADRAQRAGPGPRCSTAPPASRPCCPSLSWLSPFGLEAGSVATAVDLVHLHLLGLGRLPGGDRGDQGRRHDPGPRGADQHGDPAGHLRARRVRGRRLRRVRRGRHRPRQRGERRRRADHRRRAGARRRS